MKNHANIFCRETKPEELLPWQKKNILKETKREEAIQTKEAPEIVQLKKVDLKKSVDVSKGTTVVDSKTVKYPPEPSESTVYGREVHVSTQKQTQKEVRSLNSSLL